MLLGNIILSTLLVVVLLLASHLPFLRRRPALLHMLWLLVLLKFLFPAFIPLPLLPADRPVKVVPTPLLLPPPTPTEAPIPIQPQFTHGASPIPWAGILQALSLSGSVLLLAHTALRTLRVHRSLPQLSHPLPINFPLPVRILHANYPPFLWPLGSPTIYLPASLSLTESQRSAILAHELAHHRRRDAWSNLFAFLVCALYWWNPFIWLARRQLRQTQELCCDAHVLCAQPEQRRAYAEILYATLNRFSQSPALAPSWGGSTSLKARFTMIADPSVSPRLSIGHIVLCLLIAASLLCVPTRAQVAAAPAQPGGPSRTWKAQLLDGLTNKPLDNVRLRIDGRIYTTDAGGLISVAIPDNTVSFISIDPDEPFWASTYTYLGDNPGRRRGNEPAPNLNSPRIIKAFKGTHVTGRLLTPDNRPVPDAPLTVGVYISNQEWKKRLDMDLGFYSWDHGDWPNWSIQVVTDAQGRFQATVPPPDARSWVRVGTSQLSFTAISASNNNLVNQYAPFEATAPQDESDGQCAFGDLHLQAGVILKGKVLNAGGKPLPNVTLHTSSPHGPYAGRSTISGPDGSYEFLPILPGSLTLSPKANVENSRDVRAVFVPIPLTLPDAGEIVERNIQALPYITLEFNWVDRRTKKGQPVSYYGEFPVSGQIKLPDGSTTHFYGETELTTRNGQAILYVKVPRDLINPTLTLPADSVVIASYEDPAQKHGPGTIALGDITKPIARTIYGDNPKPGN